MISEHRRYQILVARIQRESGQDVLDLCETLHSIMPFLVSAWYNCYTKLIDIGFDKPKAMRLMWELGRNYMGPDHCVQIAQGLYSNSHGISTAES